MISDIDLAKLQGRSPAASPYQASFSKYKQLTEEVLHWKRLYEEVIPQAYAETGKEEEKAELVRMQDKVKQKYLEKIQEYKKALSDHSSNYNNEDYKDIMTLVKLSERA